MCSNRICILMGTYILLTARVFKKQYQNQGRCGYLALESNLIHSAFKLCMNTKVDII